MKILKSLTHRLFREELNIRQRLLNLILSAALIGGIVSFIATIALGDYATGTVVFILLGVVAVSLYLSGFHNQTRSASLLITGMANLVIFPWMYFCSGGCYSSMPIWFVISKIESGKMEIIPVKYELFTVLNDCYQMTKARADAKSLKFEMQIDEKIPSVLYGERVFFCRMG